MVGRYNTEHDTPDLNAGFAAPDPKFKDWQPPADQIPMSGTGQDPRFLEHNMWATKPMRQKPENLAADAKSWDRVKGGLTKPDPKLDAKGTWGDWGMTDPAKSQPPEKSKKSGDVEVSPIPCTIEGMNKVLEQRVRAASAKTAAAYANASPPAPAKKTEKAASNAKPTVVAQSPHHRNVPPHKRKMMTAQTPSLSQPKQESAHLQMPSQATAVVAPMATTKADDIFAVIKERLKNREQAKATRLEPTQHGNDKPSMVVQKEMTFGTVPALATKPIHPRLEMRNSLTAPADIEARRLSSATLVNAPSSDDELIARGLQVGGGGQEHISANAIKQVSTPTANVKGADLYEKLHKVQEVLWKQETMKLPALSISQNDLFKMGKVELNTYHTQVVSMHLAHWNARHGRVHQMLQMQAEMEAPRGYNVDEILAMNDSELEGAFKKVTTAHENEASAVNTSSSSDAPVLFTENDFNYLDDGGEQYFDSDGFGRSDDEDSDDKDGRHVRFAGRG